MFMRSGRWVLAGFALLVPYLYFAALQRYYMFNSDHAIQIIMARAEPEDEQRSEYAVREVGEPRRRAAPRAPASTSLAFCSDRRWVELRGGSLGRARPKIRS